MGANYWDEDEVLSWLHELQECRALGSAAKERVSKLARALVSAMVLKGFVDYEDELESIGKNSCDEEMDLCEDIINIMRAVIRDN
jgi:hypothetical protein